MNNKLLFLMVCLGAQSLDAAKRVCAPQAEENMAAQLTAAHEHARELQASVAAERARHVQLEAQARRAAQDMLAQSRALRNEARQAIDAHAPEAERVALRENMQRYAKRLEDEAHGGRVSIYSQALANRLRSDARGLRETAGELLGQGPVRHESFLAPQRQLFSTMPIIAPNNPPRSDEDMGSDSSDTE